MIFDVLHSRKTPSTFTGKRAAFLIGVKRNAERYMFSEPRPPVDALRARIRESRFSFRDAGADVNFLVTFAKRALLGPKVPLLLIFRILGPNLHFWLRNALFSTKSPLGQKGLGFHQNSIGFISIRGMGTQKCIFRKKGTWAPKVRFCAQNAFWSKKVLFGAKIHFLGSGRARRRFGLGVCEFVRVPRGTFCSKSHFWPKNHFLRQKCILGPKCTFGPKK